MDPQLEGLIDSFVGELSGSVGPLVNVLQTADTLSSRAQRLCKVLEELTEVRSDTASTSLELANTSSGLMVQKRNRERSFREFASLLSDCIPSTTVADILLSSDPWDPEFTSGCLGLAHSITALKRLDDGLGNGEAENPDSPSADAEVDSHNAATDPKEAGSAVSAPLVAEIREIQGTLMYFVEQKYFAYIVSLMRCLVASLPFDLSSVESSVQSRDCATRSLQVFQESQDYLNPPQLSVSMISSTEGIQPPSSGAKGQPQSVYVTHSQTQYDGPKMFQVAELVSKAGVDNFSFLRSTLPAHASYFDELYSSIMSRHYRNMFSRYLKDLMSSEVVSAFPFPEFSCSGMDFFRGSTEQQRAGYRPDTDEAPSEKQDTKRPAFSKPLFFLAGSQAKVAWSAKDRISRDLEQTRTLLFPLDQGPAEQRVGGTSSSPADSSLSSSPTKPSRFRVSSRDKTPSGQKAPAEQEGRGPRPTRIYRPELDSARLKQYSTRYLSTMGLFGSRLDIGYEGRGFAPTAILGAFYGFRWGYDRLKVVYALEAFFESCRAQGWCIFSDGKAENGENGENEESGKSGKNEGAETQRARQAIGCLSSYPAHIHVDSLPSLNTADSRAVTESVANLFAKPDFLKLVYSIAFVPSSRNVLPKCYLRSIYTDDSLMHQLPVDYAILSVLILVFSECNSEYSVLTKVCADRGAANTLLKQVFADVFDDVQTEIIEMITGNEWLRQHVPSLALLVCGASWLRHLAEEVLGNMTLGLYLGRIANGVLHILKGQVEEHIASLMSPGSIPASELELMDAGPSSASLPPSMTYPIAELLATLCFLVEEDSSLQETVGLLVIQLFRAYCSRLDVILESGGINRLFSCAKKLNSFAVFSRVFQRGFDTVDERASEASRGYAGLQPGKAIEAGKTELGDEARGSLHTQGASSAETQSHLCLGVSIFRCDAVGSGRWVLSELERALGPLHQELSTGLVRDYLPSLWGNGPDAEFPHDPAALSRLLDHIEQEQVELGQLRALLDGPRAILFSDGSAAVLASEVSRIIAGRFDALCEACRACSGSAASQQEARPQESGSMASGAPGADVTLESRASNLRSRYFL